MIDAWVESPRKNDTTAVAPSSAKTALLSCRRSTAQALTRWVRSELGPNRASRVAASDEDSPSADVSSSPRTSANGAAATAAAVSDCKPATAGKSSGAVGVIGQRCVEKQTPLGRGNRAPGPSRSIGIHRDRRDTHPYEVFGEGWFG